MRRFAHGASRRATAAVAALAALVVAAPITPAPARASGPAVASPGETGPQLYQEGDLEFALFSCNQPATPQTYTVPSGTHSVYVEAVGGQGETPNPDETGWGGLGGQVTGSLTVNPDDQLSVAVGCAGSSSGGASPYAAGGARGVGYDRQYFSMSSYGISGGGGGGASAVMANDRPLAVAGGGGGAAGSSTGCFEVSFQDPGNEYWYVCAPGEGPTTGPKGGDGGAGGNPAGNGGVGMFDPYPAAPGGGNCFITSQPAGQAGEDFDNLGAGGAGGGGGGGYLGGCGGAAAPDTPVPDPPPDFLPGIAGNGGGGGLSYADPALVGNAGFATSENAGDGYVLFVSGAEDLRTFDYPYTGSVASRCVPNGTDRIFVDAVGGAGAGNGPGFGLIGTGGGGGQVQAVVPVTAGTQVGVAVGQFGSGPGGWGDGQGGEHGKSNDPFVEDGGGGGGSSAVRSTSVPCSDPALSEGQYRAGGYLAVAGGGGGGGGGGSGGAFTYPGGDGGQGGETATAGEHGGGPAPGADGGCGGRALGSNDPNQPCIDSIDGEAGTGNTTGGGGGGGGGGYLGGGKGHAAADGQDGGGGGGGAGGSFARSVDPSQVHYSTGPDGGDNADGKVTLIVPFPAERDEVAIVAGANQSAFPGQAYSLLQVQALDDNGFPITGAPLTFSAPDGYVTFPGGSTETFATTTDTHGMASVTVVAAMPPWNTGQFAVTATVPGAPGTGIKPASFTLYNTPLPTAVKLASSSAGNQGNPDQPVTFTASVTTAQPSGFGTPSGTVQFLVDGSDAGAVDLDASGTAISPPLTLDRGVHQVTASYQGDPNRIFAPSRSNLAQAQAMAPVDATLSATQSPVQYGSPLQFTLAVTGPPNVGVSPTGTVQFAVDGTAQGPPVALGTGGNASSQPVNGLGVGLHTASALYSGDAGFLSVLRTASVYVKAPSEVSLSTSSTDPWVFRAVVASAAPGVTLVPEGNVQFSDNGQDLGDPVPLVDGVATTSPISELKAFYNTIKATYAGEDRFGGSEASTTALDASPGGAPGRPPTTISRVPWAGTIIRAVLDRLAAVLDRLAALFDRLAGLFPAVPLFDHYLPRGLP